MIPDVKLDELKTNEKEKDKITMYLNQTPIDKDLKKIGKSRTMKNIDLGDFKMRRVDVLDEENQKTYMKLQK